LTIGITKSLRIAECWSFGNSISGLEVASELATDPTITVISSARKPRYIITKIFSGMPSDCVHFTRFGVMLNRVLPPEKAAQGIEEVILKQCGSPEQYGGLKPADNIFEANIFPPCVRNGKTNVRWT
jgi:dimethylaniline monooxygenase (N-oxide forming)